MNKIMIMLNFTQLYLNGELGKCKQLGVKILNKEGPINDRIRFNFHVTDTNVIYAKCLHASCRVSD